MQGEHFDKVILRVYGAVYGARIQLPPTLREYAPAPTEEDVAAPSQAPACPAKIVGADDFSLLNGRLPCARP
jgi:hypothetical protein